jgi:CheY-like chemotaxis protein
MLKRRILLAEDDEDDQQFFYEFLKCRNDILLMPIAENGLVLSDLLEGITDQCQLPDLIILDQNMPKRNGLQTLQFLKADQRYAHIPVIIYSTYTDETLIKNGADMGACGVVPKPVTKEGYNEMLDAFLKVCTQAGTR